MKYKNQKIKMSLFFNLLKKHTDIVELKDMNDVMSSALGFMSCWNVIICRECCSICVCVLDLGICSMHDVGMRVLRRVLNTRTL